jgi:hypothetical protein
VAVLRGCSGCARLFTRDGLSAELNPKSFIKQSRTYAHHCGHSLWAAPPPPVASHEVLQEDYSGWSYSLEYSRLIASRGVRLERQNADFFAENGGYHAAVLRATIESYGVHPLSIVEGIKTRGRLNELINHEL